MEFHPDSPHVNLIAAPPPRHAFDFLLGIELEQEMLENDQEQEQCDGENFREWIRTGNSALGSRANFQP